MSVSWFGGIIKCCSFVYGILVLIYLFCPLDFGVKDSIRWKPSVMLWGMEEKWPGFPKSWLRSRLLPPLLHQSAGEGTEAHKCGFLPVSGLVSGSSDLRAQF